MKLSFSINPVALREIRQLVRSKVITVGLAAFPGALFVFTMLAVSAAMNGKSHEELMFGDGEQGAGNRDIERPENSPVESFQRDGAGRPRD